jgi:C4-dicarboxylate-specific signal transduction histidine kinase
MLQTRRPQKGHRGPLSMQLGWFIRLRWVAALAVIVGAWADHHWFQLYPQRSAHMLLVGIAIAFYNALLWVTLQRLPARRGRRRLLLMLAWMQLLLDMSCLILLIIWTGGVQSPLTPFIVLHMVFASVLLSKMMAYASAIAVIAIYLASLSITRQGPVTTEDYLVTAVRIVTLLATVNLANHITQNLRTQRRRLLRQNRRVHAITAQLKHHQQAMIQHEKMVAMGQMAAGVTHEIANPLASMDSLLQLLQRKPDRIRPEAVQTLREQIDRINQIIQQMKTFAHPENVQQQTAALNEVVEQSLHMVRFDARLKHVEVERQFSPDVGVLSFIPQALQQVMVNLIINALDAMAETPQPRLVVRTARHDGWCTVEVADNGTGIASEHMGRLFEPFFTTKPVGKGTGLGLSISYSLIQRQGGSITVRSHPGRGTSFIIRLPAGDDASRKREAPAAPVAISEKPAS